MDVVFLFFVLRFMSTILIISGKRVLKGTGCDLLFRGDGITANCVSGDGHNNLCEGCTKSKAKGEFCISAQQVVKGMKIPNKDTPYVIKNGNCNTYERLTRQNKPYGFACATGPEATQSLFCNTVLRGTLVSGCDKCKNRGNWDGRSTMPVAKPSNIKSMSCHVALRGPWEEGGLSCTSYDRKEHICTQCKADAKGEYCIKAELVSSGVALPNKDTPNVIIKGNCKNYERLTIDNKPYGFGCSEGPTVAQSLFCNAIISETMCMSRKR
ncbi:hypothetical protein DFH28DRAFT_962263 [Melampsora americana]|nr:hypothetical protein DFH28DRAFT_962263 [Melampsora americana]